MRKKLKLAEDELLLLNKTTQTLKDTLKSLALQKTQGDSQICELSTQNTALHKQVAQLQNEQDSLKEKLNAESRSKSERDSTVQEQIKQIIQMTSQTSSQNKALQEAIKELEAERTELAQKLSEESEKARVLEGVSKRNHYLLSKRKTYRYWNTTTKPSKNARD